MSREFRINNIAFNVSNTFNNAHYKYEVSSFDEKLCGWIIIGRANTLKQAKEVAYEFANKEV